MQIVLPNPQLTECLAKNIFCSPETLDQSLWQGIQVITATDFQNHVARKFGGEHLIVCNEYFRNFLGQYKQVGVDYLTTRIRLFNLVGSDAIDGVELCLYPNKVELLKLSCVYGTQVSTLVKSWQV